MNKLYHLQEFGELAGVTVRVPHIYDQWGVLKPHRTKAGYRLNNLGDLESTTDEFESWFGSIRK